MTEASLTHTNLNDPDLSPDQSATAGNSTKDQKLVEPGVTFANRKACYEAGVHLVRIKGIHGSKTKGAHSVCLSGGYEDNKDDGEFFIYTGTGGQKNSYSGDHRQVGPQNFEHEGNASLQTSILLKNPVRVVRGANEKSKWAPVAGYRYDGLYLVEKAYYDKGASGQQVCKFEFRRLKGQPPIPLNPYYEGN